MQRDCDQLPGEPPRDREAIVPEALVVAEGSAHVRVEVQRRCERGAAGDALRVEGGDRLLDRAQDALLDLGRRGASTPRTVALRSADELADAFDAIQGGTGVIKPCVGGSGRDVEQVDLAGARAYLNRNAADGRRFLLQEMLPEIAAGELSFVFIDGAHTHTVRSRPASGEFRVNSRYGPSDIALFDVPTDLVEQAASVMSLLPSPPIYARIDGVVRDGRFICLEAEAIDPTLSLHLNPAAALRLAEAVLAKVV